MPGAKVAWTRYGYIPATMESSCFCTGARRAVRSLTALYDGALAPAGLKVTQFAVLRAILRLDAPTITAVASRAGLDRSTLGRNLRVLRNLGLVTFDPGADERTRIVAVTPAGRDAVAAAEPYWKAVQERVEGALGRRHAEIASLLGELERLAH